MPHVYQCEFDEAADEYADIFRLAPIAADVLAWVLEDWAIWRRYEDAFHAGAVSIKEHPALPAERARHDELRALIGDAMQLAGDQGFLRRGEFRPANARGRGGDGEMLVRWSPVQAGEP